MRSVVQLYPGPPLYRGAVAQLGERLVCNQEATGSIPVSSTRIHGAENEDLCSLRAGVHRRRGSDRPASPSTIEFSDVPRFRHESADAVWKGSLVDISQSNVGRQCDNRFRITVHESRLAPNIGLEEFRSCTL
jgi:hypothetical protein